MVVQAVTRTWLQSRQQQEAPRENETQPVERDRGTFGFVAAPQNVVRDNIVSHDADDDDAVIEVEKRNDLVPRRRGGSAVTAEDEGFWSSHVFWKGIVVGVLVVMAIKLAIDVQAPFGIDWYDH